jgi:hypothetical protein
MRALALRHAGALQLGDLEATQRTQIEWLSGVSDLSGLGGQGRFDLVILVDQLEAMRPEARRHLLVRTRDVHGRRVAACLRKVIADEWSAAEWRALEFEARDTFEENHAIFATYAFDLETYNAQRSWNTPENWANPQNFRRHRF